jgi:hypothetical protein
MGVYGEQLIRAWALGPTNALATHMVMAQADPHYAAAAEGAGLTPEEPAQHEASLGKAADLATIAGALKAHDDSLNHHIDRMLSGKKDMPASSVMSSQDFGTKRLRSSEPHEKRAEEIRQLAGNPSELVERVTKNTGRFTDVASGISGALADRAHAAVSYLASTIQQPPKGGPLAPDWKMTEAESFDFEQRLDAVQNPMSVLKHAAAGTLTPVQAEAFQAVFPTLARQVADQAISRAMDKGDVPYSSRFMVAMLTGVDLDGTFSPEAIFRNQVAIRATGRGPQLASRSESGSKLSLAQRTAMPGQRREMESE